MGPSRKILRLRPVRIRMGVLSNEEHSREIKVPLPIQTNVTKRSGELNYAWHNGWDFPLAHVHSFKWKENHALDELKTGCLVKKLNAQNSFCPQKGGPFPITKRHDTVRRLMLLSTHLKTVSAIPTAHHGVLPMAVRLTMGGGAIMAGRMGGSAIMAGRMGGSAIMAGPMGGMVIMDWRMGATGVIMGFSTRWTGGVRFMILRMLGLRVLMTWPKWSQERDLELKSQCLWLRRTFTVLGAIGVCSMFVMMVTQCSARRKGRLNSKAERSELNKVQIQILSRIWTLNFTQALDRHESKTYHDDPWWVFGPILFGLHWSRIYLNAICLQ